ncbi:hypothetical protein Avbf_05836 [Armadillidium vulgare]|nr:hypothetical protein Avbf_05836 [Armadillidium vulgare]
MSYRLLNFYTLISFHPYARKAFKEDSRAKTSVDVRVYEDTVMTQEFYHHFVSLISVMKMKASQCARYLTSVWETIIMERLKSASVPEEYKKLLTLSKQTVKSIWCSIEEESGNKGLPLLTKTRKRKCSLNTTPSPSSPASPADVAHQNSGHSYPTSSTHAISPSAPELHLQHQGQSMQQQLQLQPQPQPQPQPQQQQQNILHHHLQSQQHQHHHEYPHSNCMKRYPPLPQHPPPPPQSHSVQKNPHQGIHSHSHILLQPPPHPQWIGPVGQAHSAQYTPNMPYTVPTHHEDYYPVQAPFVS